MINNEIHWGKLDNKQRQAILSKNEESYRNGDTPELLVTSTTGITYPPEQKSVFLLHQHALYRGIKKQVGGGFSNGTLTLEDSDQLFLAFSASSGNLQNMETIIDQIIPRLNVQLERRKITKIPVRTVHL